MAKAPSYSTGLRNAVLNGTDWTNIWDGGRLDIYDDSATPAFAASAVAGSIAKSGTWEDLSANATGTADWFRMYDSAVTLGASTTAIRMHGTVGINSGVFDLAFDSIAFTAADPITVDTFTVTIPLNQ